MRSPGADARRTGPGARVRNGDASDGGWQVAVGVLLFAAVGLYCRGLHRAWRRAGPGRGVRRSEAFAFGAGLVVLAVILGLPLHDWGRLHVAHTCSSTGS